MNTRPVLHGALAATIAAAFLGAAGGATPARSTTQRLAFQVDDALNINSFLREGPVAGHLLLRSGTEPRILVAFPAGNSGVGLWFAPLPQKASWTLTGSLEPLRTADRRGRPLYGLVAQASIAAPELVPRHAVLSSIRVLRDYQSAQTVPPEISSAPTISGSTLGWSRDRLDGGAGYRLSLEITHGTLADGRIQAAPDGTIGLRISALTGETPLTPLSGAALLNDSAGADPAARNTLTYLAYREKLLAGSWRFDTYFGRTR